MQDIDIKSLLLKISQAIDAQTPVIPLSPPEMPSSTERDRLVVKLPWTGEHYSWGEALTDESFGIPYSCVSTEFKHLSHAGRSLRLITLFLAYGPDKRQGVIELKKSLVRQEYNFDTRTLERAIYELREAGLLIEIGREQNLRNKPMRYFVMVPIGCFGSKSKNYTSITAQTPPAISPSPISSDENPQLPKPLNGDHKPSGSRFPSVFDYNEAKILVQKFYKLVPQEKCDPSKLLNETLLSSEMIRFYGKDRINQAIEFLPQYEAFITAKSKTFRWFSSCINSVLEAIDKQKDKSSKIVPSDNDPDDVRRKKLHWIRLNEKEQLLVKDKVLDLYPFIKNEEVLETIAMEVAYQRSKGC